MKLGKLAPKEHPHTLRLTRYLTGELLPPAPPIISWSKLVPQWGMLANDRLGDCVIASAGHMEQAWAMNAGAPFTPTDDQVIADYSAITGYNPSDPSTDQWTVLTDALAYWRTTGMCGGRKILGWASVNPKDEAEVRAGMFLFGGLFAGLALPRSAQSQIGGIWDAPTNSSNPNDAAGSWGGHGVPYMNAEDADDQCVTWAELQKCSWPWFSNYCDELYAIVSPHWMRLVTQQSPSGLDLAQLQADLADLPAS